jgi:hypothetical protein
MNPIRYKKVPVEDGPVDLPGVPLQIVRLLGPARQELVGLAVHLDQGAPMAGVDLVAREGTQFDLHPGFSANNIPGFTFQNKRTVTEERRTM